MRFLYLTLMLYCMLNVSSSTPGLEYHPTSPPAAISKSITVNPVTANVVKPEATSFIFQSKDGGQTWQDISYGLPAIEQPQGFFAGESGLYLRVNGGMYRSKSNLETPVWEKENAPDLQSPLITFNRSGVMAYSYEGQVYKRMDVNGTWLPINTNFKKNGLLNLFETSDGTVFRAYGRSKGLYKSDDNGQNWKQVHDGSWIAGVESEGVVLASDTKGIMRSTDKGEHWERVFGVAGEIEHIEGGFALITYSSITKSRRIHISMDKGKTWKPIDEGLRPSMSVSIKQIGKYLICGHPDGIFRSSDMGRTWDIVLPGVYKNVIHYGVMQNVIDSGADKNVFNIYVSGNVLYAVVMKVRC